MGNIIKIGNLPIKRKQQTKKDIPLPPSPLHSKKLNKPSKHKHKYGKGPINQKSPSKNAKRHFEFVIPKKSYLGKIENTNDPIYPPSSILLQKLLKQNGYLKQLL